MELLLVIIRKRISYIYIRVERLGEFETQETSSPRKIICNNKLVKIEYFPKFQKITFNFNIIRVYAWAPLLQRTKKYFLIT